MAKVVGNQIQLDSGKLVAAKTGDWQDGQQVWQDPSGNWTLSAKGVESQYSNSATAGKKVSTEVNNASAVAQGVTPTNFNDYLNNVSVKNLQSVSGTPTTSDNSATSGYVSGLTDTVISARQALDQSLADQRTETQVKLNTAKTNEATAVAGIQEATTPFREDLNNSMNESLGVNEVLASQKSLLTELDSLLTEGNELIKQEKETTGLSAIRNPRIQQTMSDISARAGVINAVVSLQNTYLSNAYTSIDRSVAAITADKQDQLTYYNTLLTLADKEIVTLTADDKALAAQQTALLKSDLDNAQATSDYIKNLMINPATALSIAQSGVTLNDSVETINQKLATYQYSQEVKTESNKLTEAGGVWVASPAGIPADQLKSFTDSKGQIYYYKMPPSKTSGTGTGTATASTIASFNNDVKTVNWSQEKDSSGNTVNISPFMKLVINYASKMSLDEIYSAYASSSLGQSYGAPTENRDMITALYNQAKGL